MIPPFLGPSAPIRRLRKLIPELSRSDQPLLIVGENGVGKGLLVHHIHAGSKFARISLRVIDLSLLGERDQRTGLLGLVPPEDTSTRRGILELPGMVLIKNVDNAPPHLQERVVEAIKDHRLSRWGSSESVPVLARSIFTLLRTPSELLSAGRLIRPLYQLLHTLRTIAVPSLRKRKQDIRTLCEYYLRGATVSSSSNHLARSKNVILRVAQKAAWQENVRDLKAFLRLVTPLSPEEAVREYEQSELQKMITMIEEGRHFSLTKGLSKIQFDLIERAVRKSHGKQREAARLLGISDRTIREYAAKVARL